MPDLAYASTLAQVIVETLAPACDRIEIAGSIRRRKPEVKDLEIVAIARMEAVNSLFGEAGTSRSAIEALLEKECKLGSFLRWQLHESGNRAGNGPRYKKLWTPFPHDSDGTKVDLFLATPENWGAVFAIRTGHAFFSEGAMWAAKRMGLQQKEGFLWRGEERLETREESAWFEAIGWPTLVPSERTLEAAQRLCPGFVPRQLREAVAAESGG